MLCLGRCFWNYLTGLQINKKFKEFWPPDLQLMANDIFRVHATIWPSLLHALNYDLPKTLFIHGYFTIDGQKMSKSLGNAIDPVYLVEKYGADSLRYFIIKNIPFGSDGDFSEKVLIERHNNELADKLGNLVSRVSALAEKYGIQKTDNKLIKKLKEKDIKKNMEDCQLDKALNLIFEFIDRCNEYVQKNKIWESRDKKKLYELVESIKEIAKLLLPFIPETSEKITKIFSKKKIKKAPVLFKKIK
jgi:methionyl-tRNA synthetase